MKPYNLYNPLTDPVAMEKMARAKELQHEYNALSPSARRERKALLGEIIGAMGDKVTIISPFYCDYGHNITIGDNFFSNMNLTIIDCAQVTIGDNVLIGPNVGIYTAGHPLSIDLRRQGLEFALPIVVGDDVWIGGHVCILPGVTIGSGSVIGAGSLVTKDVPAGVLAYGNPCRVVRQLEAKAGNDKADILHND